MCDWRRVKWANGNVLERVPNVLTGMKDGGSSDQDDAVHPSLEVGMQVGVDFWILASWYTHRAHAFQTCPSTMWRRKQGRYARH